MGDPPRGRQGTPKFSSASMNTSSAPASTAGIATGKSTVRKSVQARTAKIARCFLDRDVDRPEACDSRHQHIGIQRQHENDCDSGQSVDGANRNADAAQSRSDDAGVTEQQHQRVSGNEGRQHQRQRGQGQQHRLAWHVDAGQAEGEGSADQRGAHRRDGCGEKAVGDTVDVIPARENLRVVASVKVPVPFTLRLASRTRLSG